MDYFNVNVLLYYKDTGKYKPYLQYDKERKNTVLLMWNKNKYYPLHSSNNYFSQEDILKFTNNEELGESVNPFGKKLKGLSSYKLIDLQEKAKSLNIDIMKIHNGKSKKRTKKELYDDIIYFSK